MIERNVDVIRSAQAKKEKVTNEFKALTFLLGTIGITPIEKDVFAASKIGIKYFCLEWNSNEKPRKRVYEKDILLDSKNKVIAYQEENYEAGKYEYFLNVVKDDRICFCHKFEILDEDDDKCGNIYLNKHDEYIICIYDNGGFINILSCSETSGINNLSYSGELIGRNRDILSIERYNKVNREKPIELYSIPTLKYITSLSRKEAENEHLTPWDTNKPKGTLLK